LTIAHHQPSRVGARDRAQANGQTTLYQQSRSRPSDSAVRLSRGLGWFSIGLGLAQLMAPGALSRLIGVPNKDGARTLMRVVGVREITAGVGILTRPRPDGWVWARVAGDAMDLALLGAAFTSWKTNKRRVALATAAVVGVTALDVYDAVQLSRMQRRGKDDMHVKRAITVNRPPEEVYQFWHDFQNLPRFMDHLESVQVVGDRRSHWKAKAPAGTTVEWDAEMVEDQPNELIAWRSLPGAQVDNSGTVRFQPAPGDQGTEVRVELEYTPPGGAIGAVVAKLFGEEPGQQMDSDLRAFKQVMEVGEVVQSDASIHARPHAAQPSEGKSGR
jgi:uncharacterized membrane protein